MNTNLSPKQQRFVEEYLIDLNATQAAIRAGYSKKTARQIASENLAKPYIQNAVTEAKQRRSEALEIDADWVLQQAVALHERCMQEVRPVRNPNSGKQLQDHDGNAIFTFNAAGANRSLEIIGKHVEVAAFKDRLEVSEGLSLIERIQAGRRRVRDYDVEDAA
ncbi:MAG: terminase small subunit [Rhodospirillaceae bacterium]|jgi:phage terminase small subunit|nr:terminase small subunit [Rhodospirillaceae bacterium]